jgi:hypothetical protein
MSRERHSKVSAAGAWAKWAILLLFTLLQLGTGKEGGSFGYIRNIKMSRPKRTDLQRPSQSQKETIDFRVAVNSCSRVG